MTKYYYHSLSCDLFDNDNLEDIFKERFENVLKYGLLSLNMQNKLLNKQNKNYELTYNGNDKISVSKRYNGDNETYAFTNFSAPYTVPTLIISDEGIQNKIIRGTDVEGEYMVKDNVDLKNIVGILYFDKFIEKEKYAQIVFDCIEIMGQYDMNIPFIDISTNKQVDTLDLVHRLVNKLYGRKK